MKIFFKLILCFSISINSVVYAESVNSSTESTISSSKKGIETSDIINAAMLGTGAFYLAKQVNASMQCAAALGWTPSCAWIPVFAAAAAAAFVLANKADNASNAYKDQVTQTCITQKSLGTASSSCSNSTTSSVNEYDATTGSCTTESSQACKDIVGSIATKNTNGASKFAGVDKAKLPKTLADGSIKDSTGKVWKEADFKDEASMIKAGLTAAQAKELNNLLYGKESVINQVKQKIKDTLKDKNPIVDGINLDSPSMALMGADKPKETGFEVKKDELQVVKDEERKPSSEGLSKDFNGELIGVAGDNIFSMMNRRYQLKKDQDSFIAIEAQ